MSEQLLTETLKKSLHVWIPVTLEWQYPRYLSVCKFVLPLSNWVDLVMFDTISVPKVVKTLQVKYGITSKFPF